LAGIGLDRRRQHLARRHHRGLRRVGAQSLLRTENAAVQRRNQHETDDQHRDPQPLQPDRREHLRDRACGAGDAADDVFAILTAVSVAREKEIGTITNFYATPPRAWSS
jgi:hypothetical protein